MQFENPEQAVALAIRAIFSKWTALNLVIEHVFNGTSYLADDMLNQTIDMATNTGKRFDQDDYIDLFYDTFDKMYAEIEDNSPEQVASHILRVRDAAVQGNFSVAIQVIERAGMTNEAHGSGTSRSVEVDEKDADDCCAQGCNGERREGKPAPVIDEDGFQQVQPRRRRR